MEQDVYNFIGNRGSRFTAAYGSGSPGVPWVIVDSGNQFTYSTRDYYPFYKNMVDKALARPPAAEVSATIWREGNHFNYDVMVKNLSGTSLSAQANSATVTVIVYEDVKAAYGVQITGRVERAVVSKSIDNVLLNDNSATFSLQTRDLSGVSWSRLHSIAFVEYRPGGKTGAYDILQATNIFAAPWFGATPGNLTFLVDAMNPKNQVRDIVMAGSPSSIAWNASENLTWLSITPASGQAGQPATVQVDVSNMTRGTYTGAITITAAGGGKNYSQTIPVRVDFTQVWNWFLPLLSR